MQRVRTRLALVVGFVAMVGACARSGNPAAPDVVQFEAREVVTDAVPISPDDSAVADSAGSRWGGFIGGGG